MTTTIHTPRLELVSLEPAAIQHLRAGDRTAAETVIGHGLPEEFPSPDEVNGFLAVQLDRMQAFPKRRDWLARLMVERETNQVVGHCGFHGPPDLIGRAEIGYTVFMPFRGQGFAKEAAQALASWAFEQGEREVFATVAPNNAPSIAVVHALGFKQVGMQEDDVDGLELVFALQAGQMS